MPLKRISANPLLTGPILVLAGLCWAWAADQGILTFRQALLYGLTLSASGFIVWGLHGLRARRWRVFSLAALLAGAAFYAVHLNYLRVDYRLASAEPLRNLLPIHQDLLLVRIAAVSGMLVLSILVGLITGRFRPHNDSGSKGAKKKRRPRTAAVKSSRLVRTLHR